MSNQTINKQKLIKLEKDTKKIQKTMQSFKINRKKHQLVWHWFSWFKLPSVFYSKLDHSLDHLEKEFCDKLKLQAKYLIDDIDQLVIKTNQTLTSMVQVLDNFNNDINLDLDIKYRRKMSQTSYVLEMEIKEERILNTRNAIDRMKSILNSIDLKID